MPKVNDRMTWTTTFWSRVRWANHDEIAKFGQDRDYEKGPPHFWLDNNLRSISMSTIYSRDMRVQHYK